MFGLGSKKNVQFNIVQNNYEHSTSRKDWENVLDELFIEIAHSSKVGIAVISNTTKVHGNETSGTVTKKLNFRIDNQQSTTTQEELKALNSSQFEQLFILREKLKPISYDCYRIKKSSLLKNKLIYFVEQDEKKAILIFALPILQKQLSKHITKINYILNGAEKKGIDMPQKTPKSFSIHQFTNTKLHLLKDRLNYLDGQEQLNSRELKEMQALEEFVIRKMGESF